jgi:protein TonB
MTAGVFVVNREFAGIRSRTRRMLAVSLVLHTALVVYALLQKHYAPETGPLIEVTWLEPQATAVAVAAPEPARSEPAPPVNPPTNEVAVAPAPREVRFVREAEQAEEEPRPQDRTAQRDAVRARLDDLRKPPGQRPVLAASASPASRWLSAASAVREGTSPAAAPKELSRSTTANRPATLERGPAPRRQSRLAVAAIPEREPAAPAMAVESDETATRVLGSARISGQVADRPIVAHTVPVYPEWAMREAVEARVTLRFSVLPDGRIKENIQIVKTAGFVDFDDAAVAALRRWRFVPLSGDAPVEQGGLVTFEFRLRDDR